MLKGYLTGLEKNKHILFSMDEDDQHITLHRHNCDSWMYLFDDIKEFDTINGRLEDGRYIKMLGCRYYGNSLAAQAYVFSSGNIDPDKLTHFDRITFSGKSIDIFAGGSAGAMSFSTNDDTTLKMYGIEPKLWKDINTEYKVKINNCICSIGVNYSFYYNREWGNRNIGTCTPCISISFLKSQPINQFLTCYLWVYDFLKFMNFSRNIRFDNIIIWKLNCQVEKYEKIGKGHAFSSISDPYNNTARNTITIKDLGDHLGQLFQTIAIRRNQINSDHLFIPMNRDFSHIITHSSFLETALSFEGEFDRTQETKATTNTIFNEVKNTAVTSVIDAAYELSDYDDDLKHELLNLIHNKFQVETEMKCKNLSNKKAKIIEKYASSFLLAIDKTDFNLEEQYNYVLKKYNSIINDYIKEKTPFLRLSSNEKYNYGKIFADMRNSIGHGNPGKLEGTHIMAMQIARCLIYIMILSSIGLDNNSIKHIIRKLFL